MLTSILLRSVLTVAVIIFITRIHGLRTFSKMSGFDFAITVAIGSVLAGAITTLGTDLSVYIAALFILMGFQMALAQLRARVGAVADTLDNAPMLIMDGDEVLADNLNKCGMTEADLWAKLREANAFDLSTVRAVIVEATGDVSVLHGDPDGPGPDEKIMAGVKR